MSFFLRGPADALIILVIVPAGGLLGFWQEKGAANAVATLPAIVQIEAAAIRDGTPSGAAPMGFVRPAGECRCPEHDRIAGVTHPRR